MTFSGGISVIVKAAWGADPDGDPAGWVFVDISSDLRTPGGGLAPAVTIRKGKADESGRAAPTNVRFRLNNRAGKYSPGLATGVNFPNIVRNVPIQILISGVGPSDPYERATVFVDSWSMGWDLSTRDAICDVSASGRFRRMQQSNKVLNSFLRSAIVGNIPPPYSYWPLEDGAHATTRAASALGQRSADAYGINFAADSSADGSKALPTMTATGVISGQIPSYTATGFASAAVALNIPTPPAGTTDLLLLATNGTAPSWKVQIVPGTPDILHILAYDSLGVNLLDDTATIPDDTAFYGLWGFISIDLTQNGSNIDYVLLSNLVGGKTGTLASRTVGTASVAKVVGSAGLDGASVGHLAFWNDPTLVSFGLNTAISQFLDGLADSAQVRFLEARDFAGLSNMAATESAVTESNILLGPPVIGSVLDVWREAEDVDGGLIHDGGAGGSIIFVTRASLYNAVVAMTVDMTQGQLQNPFLPTYDDQRIITDSTVIARDGSSARYAVDIGEGAYTDSINLNLQDDIHAYELAGWRVGKGTLAGLRYPQVPINLFRSPALATQWLACKIGSRIQVNVSMTQHPADDPDLLLEGYTEYLSSRMWSAMLNCSPFVPYVTGILNSATLGHLSPTSMVLAAAWNGSAGTFTTTTTTALCSTSAGDYPLDLNIGGQRVTVSACSGSSNPQTFTVSVASVNGVSKAHSAGDAVALWQPLRLAL